MKLACSFPGVTGAGLGFFRRLRGSLGTCDSCLLRVPVNQGLLLARKDGVWDGADY